MQWQPPDFANSLKQQLQKMGVAPIISVNPNSNVQWRHLKSQHSYLFHCSSKHVGQETKDQTTRFYIICSDSSFWCHSEWGLRHTATHCPRTLAGHLTHQEEVKSEEPSRAWMIIFWTSLQPTQGGISFWCLKWVELISWAAFWRIPLPFPHPISIPDAQCKAGVDGHVKDTASEFKPGRIVLDGRSELFHHSHPEPAVASHTLAMWVSCSQSTGWGWKLLLSAFCTQHSFFTGMHVDLGHAPAQCLQVCACNCLRLYKQFAL